MQIYVVDLKITSFQRHYNSILWIFVTFLSDKIFYTKTGITCLIKYSRKFQSLPTGRNRRYLKLIRTFEFCFQEVYKAIEQEDVFITAYFLDVQDV